MASRRTRIKGIANIPQRRKPNESVEPSKDIEDKVTDSNLTSPVTVTDNVKNDSSTLDSKSNDIETPPKNEEEPKKPAIARRKFIKPPVAINNINRKPKIEDKPSIEENQPTSNKIVVLNEQIIRPANVEIVRAVSPQKPHVFNTVDILSNETHFMPNGNNSSRVEMLPNDRGTPKSSYVHTPTTPESEYPPPPPSPSKINRSRIKAIPRLSQRKTSFSASESEDESRRHFNRNRNDSVCSTTSTTADIASVSECLSPQRPGREFSSVIREKCKKKVHSRKLAEARRQFNLKYFGSNPDRQKLTMIDLIFYNPTTNPMKGSIEKAKTEEEKEEEEKIMEEAVDNPAEEIVEDENEGKSDEENEMPVPQMKVGPHGEIILDEQSLVIEKKEVKKAREEIQKSRIIEGDFDTGYGVYKRAKRSKDWSSTETLRFYKALNIIGTDFSLMCELFPKRNRRELKLKFKKEEKINKNLIDKALMNPCEFEFRELKAEVDIEEKELEMLEKQKAEEVKLKKEKSDKLLKTRKAMRIPAPSKEPIENDLMDEEPKVKKRKTKRAKRLDIMAVTELSDADESNVESESEADFEIINPPKRTRYGRIPKVQREVDWETREEMMKVSKITRVARKSNSEEDSEKKKLEPGSLMIIPTGNSEFKILMVTPDGSTTPVNLNNDAISKVMDYKHKEAPSVESVVKISAERKVSAPAIEYNVTIPASEETTT